MDTPSQITASKTLSNLYKFAHIVSRLLMIPGMTFLSYLLSIKSYYFNTIIRTILINNRTCKTHSTQDVCSHQVVKRTRKLMPSRG